MIASRWLLLPITFCVLTTSISVAGEAKDIVGKYTAKGITPEGEKYSGTAEIVHKAGNTVEITWQIGRRKTIGLGRLVKDTLTIEYQGAILDREGKATYEVKPKGRIVGKWHTKGRDGVGTETLIPEK